MDNHVSPCGDETEALYRIATAVGSSLDMATVLQTIVEEAARLVDVSSSSLFLYRAESGELAGSAAYGPHAAAVLEMRVPLSFSATASEAIRSGQPVVVTDAVRDERMPAPLVERFGITASLIVPVRMQDETLGVLILDEEKGPRAFSAVELRLVTGLAQYAAIAITNARLFQETRRRASELGALIAIDRDISSTLELSLVLQRIATHAREILEADDSDIYLIEPDGETLRAIVSVGPYAAETMASPTKIGKGVVGRVAQTGTAEKIDDMNDDPRAVHIPGTPDEAQSMMCAPLRSKGETIGVMVLNRMGRAPFSAADFDFLISLSQQAAIAIENARLFERVQAQSQALTARTRDLELLVRAAQTLSASLDLGETLEQLVRIVREPLNAAVCAVSLTDDEGETFTLAAIQTDGQVPVGSFTPGQHFSAAAVPMLAEISRTLRPVFVADVQAPDSQSMHNQREREVARRYGFHSALVLPMVHRNRLEGVVSLRMTEVLEEPPPERLAWIEAVVSQAAVSVANARLFADAQRHADNLERLNAELVHLDCLRDQLIQNVSHELRTPLALVQGYVELLHDGGLGPLTPKQAQALHVVTERTSRLSELVEAVTTLQQIETVRLKKASLDLTPIAQAALRGATQPATRMGVTLKLEAPYDLPPAMADVVYVGKMFHMLLDNAIKFSPQDSTVTIRLRAEAENVRIEVIDQGIGIPAEQLDRVFERFYQVDGSAARRYGGIGLGLAIVKEIVHAHHGQVWAESEGPGAGSTFVVLLPRAFSGNGSH